MPPVDAPGSDARRPHFMQVAMFLPQFVREKKRDDKQRNDEKDAQYQVFDHGGLQSQEHVFIVGHRICPEVPRADKRSGLSVDGLSLAPFMSCT
jgi:hypothetical protein